MEGGGVKKDNIWVDILFYNYERTDFAVILHYNILKKKQSILTMFSKRSQRNFGINLRFVGRYITDRMCSG